MKPRWRDALAFWFGILAGGSLIPGPVYCEELVCPDLKISSAASDTPERQRRGLLWRITKPGVPASYLFGTIHLAGEELTALPPPVASAFDKSRRFVMEAILGNTDLEQWTQSILTAEGGSLRSQLGPALYERSAGLMSRYGVPAEALDSMKPWAVYVTLSTPPDAGGLPLDLVLALRAEQAGKTVDGLETAGEQIDIVAGLPLEDQVALVKDAVCHYDVLQEDIKAMKRLYLDRDLAGLVAASNRYELIDTPRYQRLMRDLLWERNERLAKRMAPHLEKGDAFIALGALHLPGKRGLLSLLERSGYTVEPVY